MKKYDRTTTNRFNNNLGHQLEDLILLGCKIYRQKGIADIDKTPEPFRVISKKSNGAFAGRFIGKAQPDFSGTVRNGISIVFEAKATRTDKLKQNVISEEQWRRLEMHWQLGAVVGVVCQIQKSYAFIPWELWRNMETVIGRKHLRVEDFSNYLVKTPGYIDFLPQDMNRFRNSYTKEVD